MTTMTYLYIHTTMTAIRIKVKAESALILNEYEKTLTHRYLYGFLNWRNHLHQKSNQNVSGSRVNNGKRFQISILLD